MSEEIKTAESLAENTLQRYIEWKGDFELRLSIINLITQVRAERQGVDRELIYVPGHWQCPKCNFYQVNSILHPNGISADRRMPEQCPNDGTEMIAVTWKQNAQDGHAGQQRLSQVLNELEEKISILTKENEDLKKLTHFGYSEVPELKEKIATLTNSLARCREALKKIQFGSCDGCRITGFCPECSEHEDSDEKHTKDCSVGKALAEENGGNNV